MTSDLIERLEAGLLGRDLDVEVWLAATGENPAWPCGEPDSAGPWITSEGAWAPLPRLTFFFDDAMRLADRLHLNGPCELHRSGPAEWGFSFADSDTVYACRPANAACIAILQAKAQTEPGEGR